MFKRFKAWLHRTTAPAPAPLPPAAPAQPQAEHRGLQLPADLLARARAKGRSRGSMPDNFSREVFKLPKAPPGLPAEAAIAMDSNIQAVNDWTVNYGQVMGSFWSEGVTFLGYPYLAELAQRPEYRVIAETIANEMTRKWIRFTAKDTDDADEKASEGKRNRKDDKAKRISQLEEEFKRLRVRDLFTRAAEQDGFFGRGHLYLDTGDTDDPEELKKDLGNGWDKTSEAKVSPKRPLKELRTIEAVWCYPTNYDSWDPLKPEWFVPREWYVQSKIVHASRLLTFIGREVPDLLKPTYAFGGLSMTQMAKPYVDNWLETRQSVNEIIHSFVTYVLHTDMSATTQAGGSTVIERANLFNTTRDNQGLMILDKNAEDFTNVVAPLAGLHELQAQAQEHMASVSHTPTVKLLGIQPAGLNADSEGVMRAFYDYVHSYQEHLFRDKLRTVMGFAMLSLWGEVDHEIDFEFEPLWSLDEKGQAEVNKTRADTDVVLIDGGIISPEEARARVAADPDSGYNDIDPDDVPEPPMGDDPLAAMMDGEDPDADPLNDKELTDAAEDMALDDIQWEESKHPRDKDGKFTSGTSKGGGKVAEITKSNPLKVGSKVQWANGKNGVVTGLTSFGSVYVQFKKDSSAHSLAIPVSELKHYKPDGEASTAAGSKAMLDKVSKTFESANNVGYTMKKYDTDTGHFVLSKGNSNLYIDEKTSGWVLETPPHMPKKGPDAASLQALLSGKPAAEWQKLGVTNATPAEVTKAKQGEGKLTPSQQAEKEHWAAHEHANALRKQLAKSRPVPNSAENSAIQSYKGSGYTNINRSLRDFDIDSPTAQNLGKYLNKSVLNEDCTLWRGIRGEYARTWASMAGAGMVFRDPGFSSSSTNEKFSRKWIAGHAEKERILFKIDAKAGQHGTTIAAEHNEDGEYEVVLQANAHYRVISFDRKARVAHVELVATPGWPPDFDLEPADVIVGAEERQKELLAKQQAGQLAKAAVPAPAPAAKPQPTPSSATAAPQPSAAAAPQKSEAGEKLKQTIKAYKKNPKAYVIQLTTGKNPKKPGSASHEAFSKYSDDMTVAEYMAKFPTKADATVHLDYDYKKGFIDVIPV